MRAAEPTQERPAMAAHVRIAWSRLSEIGSSTACEGLTVKIFPQV